jgi:viroplasmin and RNaseH domain-containing protein
MKKVYAIKKGMDPQTGNPVENLILEKPWSEGEPFIKGVAGAVYKGFKTREEAERYLALNEGGNISGTELEPETLHCFVDGSYNKAIQNYGFGLVCVKDGKVVHTDRGSGKNPEAVEMFQVGGELLGAMQALLYAKKAGETHVVIHHDYEGVGKHATGEWGRKTAYSKTYYDWMQRFFRENPTMRVEFRKVTAHTGNEFNELADGYAKLAVGLEPAPVFFRMAVKHQTPIT